MTRRTIYQILVALLYVCGAGVCVTGCKGKMPDPQPVVAEAETVENEPETYMTAIDRYLTEEIGSQYVEGEVCIPCYTIIGLDKSSADDIKAWGDFWVFNYQLSGDTLKCISGGSHPGLMHLRQADGHFQVTAFDVVEDGSRYLSSAKRIFGDKFADFQKISSDEKGREEVRAAAIAAYVKQHHLSATMYQDYGWEPVSF